MAHFLPGTDTLNFRFHAQRHSGGEQQRLAIARVMLEKPDWLLLDEATSALEEGLEAEIHRMLIQVLPNTTIVSIGHRSTLIAVHLRHIEMVPHEGGTFEPLATTGVQIVETHAATRFHLNWQLAVVEVVLVRPSSHRECRHRDSSSPPAPSVFGGQASQTQLTVRPRSTTSSVPVIYFASSDARNRAA
jgi:ABC-type sulfate/molybdate transport systems ATPase subunit